MLRSLTRSVGK